MKKFIKGTFELDENITNLEAYEENKKVGISQIIDWGEKYRVGIVLGTSDDNFYLCEYKIVANTKAMCNGMLKELKSLLKAHFPYVKSLWQGSGDQLW